MGGDPSMMGGDPNAMGGDPMMGDDPNMMGGDPSMMGGDANAMGGDENYGADFDAGVEANEDEDPKKFNQQLTGKLSQSLQKYEDSLGGQPDDLPKYVGGMILAQLAKYMEPSEFDEMVQDAKDGMQPTEDNADDGTDANADMIPSDDTQGGVEGQDTDMQAELQPMSESVKRRINELFQDINKSDKEEKKDNRSNISTTKTGPITYKRKAFTSPNLKK